MPTSHSEAVSSQTGCAFVVLAAVLWGVSGTAAKFLFNGGITPFQLVQMRLTITAVALAAGLGLCAPSLLKIDRRDILYFAVFGTVGMASVQFTYLFAISRIHVAAAILLQYLAPGFIAIHAVVFFRDRLNVVTLVALAGAFLGCYLVVGAYNLDLLSMNALGIASGVLSAVSFAWYSIQGEYGMRRYSPWTVLCYAMGFAAITWNVLYPPLEGFLHAHRPIHWFWIFFIGILGTLAPFGFYLEGVSRIRSTRASITATLEPITAGLVAYLFLDEVMAPAQVLGAAIVIGAVALLQIRQEMDALAPARLRAAGRSRPPEN